MALFRTLPRPKIRDQAAAQIKDFIVSRQLKTGDRLPNENELAVLFGISRLSVREATKSLEFLGIIEAKTGVGLTVGQIDVARLTEHLGFHPALHGVDPIQLIETRIIIETGVLPHVARRMADDAAWFERLESIVEQSCTARDLKTWIDLDIEFHRTLLEASGLEPLVAFGDLLHVFFQRFRESVKKAEWKVGIDSHRRIIHSLAAGKVAPAVEELRTHIDSHRQRLSRVI
jgi:GntR family transcriptional regulator, transcriptional repressor for pyruvate dehydrogenase complex